MSDTPLMSDEATYVLPTISYDGRVPETMEHVVNGTRVRYSDIVDTTPATPASPPTVEYESREIVGVDVEIEVGDVVDE